MKKQVIALSAAALSALMFQATPAVAAQDNAELKKAIKEVLAEQNEMTSATSAAHMAGYASVLFAESDAGGTSNSSFSTVQFAPIFHYEISDQVLLESEFNVELDGEDTDLELEYLTIDWLINDNVALLAGKFLSPVGQFVQNIHPAWINRLPSMPAGFGHGGAAPTSEVGLQLRGGFEGKVGINYSAYVANGPELDVEAEDVGGDDIFDIHAVEGEGTTDNADDEYVFGGRIGIMPSANLEIGISLATGNAQAELVGAASGEELLVSPDYDVFGMDLFYRRGNLRINAEYVKTEIGVVDLTGNAFTNPDVENGNGAEWEAWYAQAAYRFGTQPWEVVGRFAETDMPEENNDLSQVTVGVNYYIANNAVAKLAIESNDFDAASANEDFDRVLLQIAYGF